MFDGALVLRCWCYTCFVILLCFGICLLVYGGLHSRFDVVRLWWRFGTLLVCWWVCGCGFCGLASLRRVGGLCVLLGVV